MATLHGGSALSFLSHSRLRAGVLRIAALSCVGVFATTGVALADATSPDLLASCPPQPVTSPFTQWGDTNSYFLAPGGSFEGTSDQVGWTLSGASLTSGNEPFYVNSPSDSQSLTISGGGSATSPYFCVDNTMSSLRFFAQEATAGSDLQVQALVQTRNGVNTVPLADLTDGSMPSWAPTDPIAGDTGGLPDGRMLRVALQFSVPQPTGSWQLDDVYVDPYRSG
jgi:hypothetical protein